MESENFWIFGSFRNGILFFAVGWVVAFGDGFFHMFVPVEHVVLLKAVL